MAKQLTFLFVVVIGLVVVRAVPAAVNETAVKNSNIVSDVQPGIDTTTIEPPANTTTTPAPTPAPTPSNTTTAPTTVAPTNATTLPTNATTTVPTTVPTTSTSTVAPATNSTTPAAPSSTVSPTAAPSGKDSGSWGWGSFFAGIVFTAGISSVAYVVFRFYKARTDSNYHTL